MHYSALIFLFFLVASPLFAQKLEVEKKVKESAFPSDALVFLQKKYPDRGRTKYYFESGSDGENYEAKFKWEGHCHSVEFFQDGKWKDAEKEIEYEDLAEGLRQKTEAVFDRDFIQTKVKRVQEQTVPDRPNLRYEMEVKGKSDDGRGMWEYLFEADGTLVQKRKIILPSNNITLY